MALLTTSFARRGRVDNVLKVTASTPMRHLWSMRLWVATCLTVALTITGAVAATRSTAREADGPSSTGLADRQLRRCAVHERPEPRRHPRLPGRRRAAAAPVLQRPVGGLLYTPSSQFVTLQVDADDYAEIWIDGELRFAGSVTAEQDVRVDAGFHELRIRLPAVRRCFPSLAAGRTRGNLSAAARN